MSYILKTIIHLPILEKPNKKVYFSGIDSQPKLIFKKMGFFDKAVSTKVFEDYEDCIKSHKKIN